MIDAWPTAAERSQYDVHLGIWTNWSINPVFGRTLTLTRDNANILVAFTAIFIGIVGSRTWHIACLVFHRYYSTPEPRDAIHHQRQVIFRNSASAEAAIWFFLQLAWNWRHSNFRNCLLRIFPAILSAFFFSCVFTVAGGLSSKISTPVGEDILIKGASCGISPLHGNAGDSARHIAYISNFVANAANYAKQCYVSSNSGPLSCNIFVNEKLPSSKDTNFSCPFQDVICRNAMSNIRLDTGYIGNELGINTPRSQDIQLRRVLQCAPVVTKGHSHHFNTAEGNFTRFYYGALGSWRVGNNRTQSYTYQTEDVKSQYRNSFATHLNLPFRLEYVWEKVHLTCSIMIHVSFANRSGAFHRTFYIPVYNGTMYSTAQPLPSPSLYRTDGDIILIFLSGNGVWFSEPSDDDWYRANVSEGPIVMYDVPENTTSYYRPDEDASPMACLEQYQWCNARLPRDRGCGPLGSFQDASLGAYPLFNITSEDDDRGYSDTELGSHFIWIYRGFKSYPTSVANILLNLGPEALASRASKWGGLQGRIPHDQWQLDVTYWWAISLAVLQNVFIDIARGSRDIKRLPPGNSYQQDICNNQVCVSCPLVFIFPQLS